MISVANDLDILQIWVDLSHTTHHDMRGNMEVLYPWAKVSYMEIYQSKNNHKEFY